jgi:hypothetical protein
VVRKRGELLGRVPIDLQFIVGRSDAGAASGSGNQNVNTPFQEVFHLLSLRIIDGTNSYHEQERSRNQPVLYSAAAFEKESFANVSNENGKESIGLYVTAHDNTRRCGKDALPVPGRA